MFVGQGQNSADFSSKYLTASYKMHYFSLDQSQDPLYFGKYPKFILSCSKNTKVRIV